MSLVSLDDSILFFDLAGTLIEIDGNLPPERGRSLLQVTRQARKTVLVTGQPYDDPQVQQILSLFCQAAAPDFVAYLTRGATRWVRGSGKKGFVLDEVYSAKMALSAEQTHGIIDIVGELLDHLGMRPLIPVSIIDGAVVRVNLRQDEREQALPHFEKRFASEGFDAVAEGRTSIYVTQPGVGKRVAVSHELTSARRDGWSGNAFYFGDQAATGNDRDVLGIEGLTVFSLGPCASGKHVQNAWSIGELPDDLERFLLAETKSSKPELAQCAPIKVLCLGLGGTKIEIGAWTRWGTLLRSPQFFWRQQKDFQRVNDDLDGSGFCKAIVSRIETFLADRGYRIDEIDTIGIPFPGPGVDGGMWYSNNLSPGFATGVNLEYVLTSELEAKSNGNKPAVRIALDAKADAAGELYHPRGRLYKFPHSGSMVINLATGIAAGFTMQGRVLVTNEDFALCVGNDFDANSGQLGRHLFREVSTGLWRYCYRPRGDTPLELDANSVRMTDRLSGPALALRLLRMFRDKKLLTNPHQLKGFDPEWIAFETNTRALSEIEAVIQVRNWPKPISVEILSWADRAFNSEIDNLAQSVLLEFATEVAAELADALSVFFDTSGWGRFADVIVLTGGIGQRFLVRADDSPEKSFLHLLETSFHERGRSPHIMRSELFNAVERECLLFVHQKW